MVKGVALCFGQDKCIFGAIYLDLPRSFEDIKKILKALEEGRKIGHK